jgi:hypothetical protein
MDIKGLSGMEQRLSRLEMALGIVPEIETLRHPKAFRQAVGRLKRQQPKQALETMLSSYIAAHYDLGVQMSMLALCLDPGTPLDVKAQIQTVWAWLRQVLAHYYQVAQAIRDGQEWIEPDFAQFDQADPRITLKRILFGR